ncbi:MAG: hypothetical protein WAM82_22890 [Thermoanaerobaculia bacterium]
MKLREVEALGRYRDELMNLAEIGVPGAKERVNVYSELVRIATASPLQENVTFSADSVQGRTPLKELVGYSAEAFCSSGTPDLLADRLAAFEEIMAIDDEGLPEELIMLETARRWLRGLRGEEENAFLLVSLAVSLDHEVIEEDLHSASGPYSLDLPISIENRGRLGAGATSLYLRALGDGKPSIEDSVWDKQKRLWTVRLGDITGHSGLRRVVTVRYEQDCVLEFWAESSWSGAASASERMLSSNHLEVILHTPTPPLSVVNPYVADLPLISELQWERLVKGRHKALVAELSGQSWGGEKVVVLRGCRRTGKTTVLRRIAREVEAEKKFMPLVLDVFGWWENRMDGDDVLGAGDICFELAASAQRYVSSLAVGNLDIAESVSRNSGVLQRCPQFSLSAEGLREILGLLSQATDRQGFIFFIDELDIPVIRSNLKGNASVVLDLLEELASGANGYRMLVTHDWSSRGWKTRFDSGGVSVLPRRVPFLSLPDLQRLAEVSESIKFTDLAVEYIWCASGGWPGLAQLLFQRAVDYVAAHGGRFPIDIKIMKAVAKEVLVTEHNYIAYMSESISEEEWTFLVRLVGTAERFSEHGYTRKVVAAEGPLIQALAEKEIIHIDEANKTCRLRVGLLAQASRVEGV